MTFLNSVLLIVKQSPGIDYNSLLNKVSPNYSSVNSARAALSRTLKDASVFGFVLRKNNGFFLTDKADSMLMAEMKNKLVLKLNKSIASGKQGNVDDLVETLSTLIARARHDESLLKAAKGSSDFFISDIQELAEKTGKKISHLQYLLKVLESHLDSLKELDFNEKKQLPFSEGVALLLRICRERGFEEITIEAAGEKLQETLSLALGAKFKDNSATIKKNQLADFFSLVEKQAVESGKVSVFLPPIKARLGTGKCFLVAPFSSLKNI